MNNSIKYIKNLIVTQPERMGEEIKNINWENSEALDLFTYATSLLNKNISDGNNTIEIILSDEDKVSRKFSKVTISYNPNADFGYFTTDISTHDGTCLFIFQAMERIFKKIASVQTYDLKQIPKDLNENTFFDYEYFYEIGDALLSSDVGMKEINGNRTHGTRDVMILPIKFWVEKKDMKGEDK